LERLVLVWARALASAWALLSLLAFFLVVVLVPEQALVSLLQVF